MHNFIHWLYYYDIMKLSIRCPYHCYPPSNTIRTEITGGLYDHNLENQTMTAQIDSIGAQLISLKSVSGTEYIWQRDPAHWKSCSPLLFPTIGNCRDGKYTLNGQTYTIPKHGFAGMRTLPSLMFRMRKLLSHLPPPLKPVPATPLYSS